MENLFIKTNGIGKKGEDVVKQYYKNKGCVVVDVSDDPEYQKQDIDLIINGQTVEVKTATNLDKYRSFCVELVSNDTPSRYKEGWFLTSNAQVVIYYSTKERIMYQMNLEEMRQIFKKNSYRYRRKRVVNNEFSDVYKASILSFIPIEDMEAEALCYRKVELKEGEML